jgi:hypothetical protein
MTNRHNYTKELYDAMNKHFGQKGNDVGDMIIDTSASDHGTFEDCLTPWEVETDS